MTPFGKLVSLVSRRTLRAEGHVFAITPESIANAEGVHASLAMAPMLCAAALWGIVPRSLSEPMRRSGTAFAIRKDRSRRA